jgi:hypothetical protein
MKCGTHIQLAHIVDIFNLQECICWTVRSPSDVSLTLPTPSALAPFVGLSGVPLM